MKKEKTIDEVLSQKYMSADDLKIIMPTLGIQKCRDYITEMRELMKAKKYFVPEGRTKIALTKLIIKEFGL